MILSNDVWVRTEEEVPVEDDIEDTPPLVPLVVVDIPIDGLPVVPDTPVVDNDGL